VVKTAVLDCLLDGKPVKFTGTDTETLCLAVSPTVESAPAAQLRTGDGTQLSLEAWQGGRYELKTASGRTLSREIPEPPAPIEVDGPWNLSFPAGWEAPSELKMEKLISLSDCQEAGVKYFSGTTTYRKTLTIPASLLSADRRLYLDLGGVKVIAQVSLNDQDLGTLWKPPFTLDITDVAKKGDNELVVRVTNLWPNRLIGDEQKPEDSTRNADGSLKEWPQWLLENGPSPTGRLTFSTWRFYNKDSKLFESGLLGPVRLVTTQVVPVEE
jgi:hypothetical protein